METVFSSVAPITLTTHSAVPSVNFVPVTFTCGSIVPDLPLCEHSKY